MFHLWNQDVVNVDVSWFNAAQHVHGGIERPVSCGLECPLTEQSEEHAVFL